MAKDYHTMKQELKKSLEYIDAILAFGPLDYVNESNGGKPWKSDTPPRARSPLPVSEKFDSSDDPRPPHPTRSAPSRNGITGRHEAPDPRPVPPGRGGHRAGHSAGPKLETRAKKPEPPVEIVWSDHKYDFSLLVNWKDEDEDELVERMRAYFEPVKDIGHEGMAKIDTELKAKRKADSNSSSTDTAQSPEQAKGKGAKPKNHQPKTKNTNEEAEHQNGLEDQAATTLSVQQLLNRSERAEKEKILFNIKKACRRAARTGPPEENNTFKDSEFKEIIDMYKNDKTSQRKQPFMRQNWSPSGHPQ